MDATLSSDEPIPSNQPCIISEGLLKGLSVTMVGAVEPERWRVRVTDLAGVYLEIPNKTMPSF